MADNNSFKQQEEKHPDFEERKKDMVQFSSAKQLKPKPENTLIKWLCNVLFSGRKPKDIIKEVAENQVIPQMKDNFRNSLVSVLDLAIYKDHKSVSNTVNTIGNFVTNYVSYSDKTSQQKKLEDNKKKEEEILKSGFEIPAFYRKKDAEDFIASMHNYITKYKRMTVLDIAWMQGKTINYTWDAYEWDEEEILAIKAPTHINNPNTPWAVMLPKAHTAS